MNDDNTTHQRGHGNADEGTVFSPHALAGWRVVEVEKRELPVKARADFGERHCLGCGRAMRQLQGPGRPRKTCGQRCRKRVQRAKGSTA